MCLIRWARSHVGRIVAFALVLIAALVLCVQPLRQTYTPEVAGVVVRVEPGPGSTAVFLLANGHQLRVPANTTGISIVGGILPHVGDLLLGGSGGRYGVWVARVSSSTRTDVPPGCYQLSSFATDEGAWIRMDFGLRVQKAPSFEVGPGLVPHAPGDRYEGLFMFCLNDQGEVTSYR